MNDMNETEEMDGSSGAESYRAFLDKFVEYGGNPELIKGLAPKAQPTKSRLPHVSTESDALAFARAFRTVYVFGNPECKRFVSRDREAPECLIGGVAVMLTDYFPESDWTFEGLHTLVGMEKVWEPTSSLGLLVRQASKGVSYVPKNQVKPKDASRMLDEVTATRLLGFVPASWMTCMYSDLRRKSDGVKPAQHERPGGLRGFTAEEDAAVALYGRFLAEGREERFAAVEELDVALSLAIHPHRRRACDVSYSLLDTLIASGCRAVIDGGSGNKSMFMDSQRELKRCMDDLNEVPRR